MVGTRFQLCIVLAVALSSQPAAAQLTFGTAQVTGSPITAVLSSATITIHATYQCGPTQVAANPGQLVVEVATPPGINVNGLQNVAIPANACQGAASTAWQQDLTYTVASTRDVPGLTPFTLQFNGSVAAQTAVPKATAQATATLQVDYIGFIEANLDDSIAKAHPLQNLTYILHIANRGNARTTVNVTLAVPPAAGWTVRLPDPLVLDASPLSTSAKNVTIEVLGPDKANVETSLQFLLTPHATAAPAKVGPAIQAVVLARVQIAGLGQGRIPGLGPEIVLVLLGAAVPAARRRA